MSATQGGLLLSRLQALKSQKIQLKVSSGIVDSAELKTLAAHGQRLSCRGVAISTQMSSQVASSLPHLQLFRNSLTVTTGSNGNVSLVGALGTSPWGPGAFAVHLL